MKNAILIELAQRWENDAKQPEYAQTYEEGETGARLQGRHTGERETLRMCADTLRTLAGMFPDATT